MSTAKKKRARSAAIATSLGLKTEDRTAVLKVIAAIDKGLSDAPKGERKQRAAKQLGVTPDELLRVRRALSGNVPGSEAAAASIRRIIAYRKIPVALDSTSPPGGGRQTSSGSRARNASGLDGWNLDSQVFVTPEGHAVHIYADCSGMRGFRHAKDPDPEVLQVSIRDSICAQRRFCEICTGGRGKAHIAEVDALIEDFHGAVVPGSGVARRPASGPKRRSGTGPAKRKKRVEPVSALERMKEEARRSGRSIHDISNG